MVAQKGTKVFYFLSFFGSLPLIQSFWATICVHLFLLCWSSGRREDWRPSCLGSSPNCSSTPPSRSCLMLIISRNKTRVNRLSVFKKVQCGSVTTGDLSCVLEMVNLKIGIDAIIGVWKYLFCMFNVVFRMLYFVYGMKTMVMTNVNDVDDNMDRTSTCFGRAPNCTYTPFPAHIPTMIMHDEIRIWYDHQASGQNFTHFKNDGMTLAQGSSVQKKQRASIFLLLLVLLHLSIPYGLKTIFPQSYS